jgi:hypothetical protein
VRATVGRRCANFGNLLMKKIALALALFLGAAVVLPVLTASSAEAQSRPAGCRYTSSDVSKGYRC